jgi:UDP-galactopyranose mutase
MKEKILILGGGVAGSSMAYFLSNKGYDIDLIEKNKTVGGLARTCYYAGHPYEFGPHVWFWPGGIEADINKVIINLTNDELYYIDRKLFTYVESDREKYRYPIHFSDIENMPNNKTIYNELKKNRTPDWKIIDNNLPVIGDSKFEDYFIAALGKSLYSKFMENYSWKMWNIPGNELETSMVWADRFKHAYSSSKKGLGLPGYDPLKFEDHTLGKGIKFQVYPKKGWNAVWDKMVENTNIIQANILGIKDEHKKTYVKLDTGENYYFNNYKYVYSTLDMDILWGEDTLPYTGRMMVPLLLPDLKKAFPLNTESMHYSSAEFQTRVTEMKMITNYNSPDTLLLIEIPILPGAKSFLPKNVVDYGEENNLFAQKAYPQQSQKAFKIYKHYLDRGKKIKNLRYVGRHAEFKYWGMPETVNSAYNKSFEL